MCSVGLANLRARVNIKTVFRGMGISIIDNSDSCKTTSLYWDGPLVAKVVLCPFIMATRGGPIMYILECLPGMLLTHVLLNSFRDILEYIRIFYHFQQENITGIHEDGIKWNHFPCHWPSVRGTHRSPVNSPDKGQWHRALMFSFICAKTNGWINNRDAGDLRRHRSHYYVTEMLKYFIVEDGDTFILFSQNTGCC